MPDRHTAGYHVNYQRARRIADRRLKEAHEVEWRRHFDDARSLLKILDDDAEILNRLADQ